MIGISSKVDYALITIVELAAAKNGKFLSLSEIAKKRHMSANYLAQLMLALKKKGLIESKEGKAGGHRLAKSLDKIFLVDVMSAFEGGIALSPCLHRSGRCKTQAVCTVKHVWRKVQNDFVDYASHKTLSELLLQKFLI
ncbi:MAG: RRF2 protein family [Candidatus Peregrinibacteria bacterium GW2011_GWF2_33_10]|nr:MAG: RRF2 protein family [Candidatus Peregrinibacteria bacterium GW2011_GWF2_33_10]OGJ45777.1 MAG: hypothetical protein A2263_01235 [Candidatus Peregrinibacteria bacterium RIFOXYA2_FULL_33_21]OGJ46837.1 MAG: hypothetical protein A2272_00835 [Candidatus Peregrinibacteria bacterium RIFOXYA12_FULL_33_12]OGJ51307.1 MAG: hypothetical protein A2307_00510 [Candidatus Peregrinibacteria bacterium RIFOXYB2_FULL_33_20]